jgi:SAM-dependent methyltransferase
MTEKQDPRVEIYHELNEQLIQEAAQHRTSAHIIFKLLSDYVQFQSVLDVGCGLGGWLKVAGELGARDVRGIEGHWLDRSKLTIDPALVTLVDLENEFSLQRRFDLVICLEVAEHLSPASADRFVRCLTDHGDLVLFSAAIPFQEGHHHVNEQYPEYWAEKFSRLQFRPVDLIRPRLWNDGRVTLCYRQNILLFVRDSVLAGNARLRDEASQIRPLNLVHPRLHDVRNQAIQKRLQKCDELMKYLAQEGEFVATRAPDGQVRLIKR